MQDKNQLDRQTEGTAIRRKFYEKPLVEVLTMNDTEAGIILGSGDTTSPGFDS
ncbi:MAG: hypothetical protein PHV82_19400 [Victivallaceae bacterium]|nr:hypothetical protein [Victivallaceae bacterium]